MKSNCRKAFGGLVRIEGKAGCGGVLQDKKGVARVLFPGSVTAYDVDVAKANVVKVALDVFVTMNWKIYDSLFIEIGSLVLLSWCVNKAMRPWYLQAMFADINRDLLKDGKVVFSVADRKCNEMALLHWLLLSLTGRICLKVGGEILVLLSFVALMLVYDF
ncbi:hypothetical protein PVK06_036786 [Gossypium arboreum]|uniref:Uncharacterized protein n=1 Tax=Gossypium arboreum TaxID=29729 RepID=A0ABR0NKH7_GOSAR|nr:hypothetical protein PVK06_036786 [Gossypium arboreum]